MSQTLILYPLLTLVGITFLIGFSLVTLRIRAVARGELPGGYFRLNRGARVPDYLLRLEQHYSNQFEMPSLFYLWLVLTYLTQSGDALTLGLAWGFVATRLGHTVVHLGRNNVRLRAALFVAGVVLLLLGWLIWAARMVG